MTTKSCKKYINPSIQTMDFNIQEELLTRTVEVDPKEEGNQEEAEIREREWMEMHEQNNPWDGKGLW